MIEDDIDDGSDKPEGYQTADGELEVRDGEYRETEMGQFQRWMRQAPDLYAKYLELLERTETEFSPSYCGKRRRFSLFFRWFDLWVGAYWDRKSRVLYICPLPTIGIRIAFAHPASAGQLLKRLARRRS